MRILEQKCEFDAPEINYIAQDYYKIKAGFDCQKAGTLTEKAICANADLAESDRAINVLYLGAREATKEFALDEADMRNLPIKQNLSQQERQSLCHYCKKSLKCTERLCIVSFWTSKEHI